MENRTRRKAWMKLFALDQLIFSDGDGGDDVDGVVISDCP